MKKVEEGSGRKIEEDSWHQSRASTLRHKCTPACPHMHPQKNTHTHTHTQTLINDEKKNTRVKMVGTHIFIFYCFKQHTHKVENKHVQSDSAAWPKCTGNTDTHNQNSAGLALAEGTLVLAMGCGSFQCRSMGSKTPLTTILQRAPQQDHVYHF